MLVQKNFQVANWKMLFTQSLKDFTVMGKISKPNRHLVRSDE